MRKILNLKVLKDCNKNLNYCAEPILLMIEALNQVKQGELEILINKAEKEKILRTSQIMDCKILKEIELEDGFKIIIKKED